jgi:hypothetical protein
MPADVAERAQRAVVVAQDQHRLPARVRGEIGAGVRQRGDVRRELPAALEDAAVLELDDFGVSIEPRR